MMAIVANAEIPFAQLRLAPSPFITITNHQSPHESRFLQTPSNDHFNHFNHPRHEPPSSLPSPRSAKLSNCLIAFKPYPRNIKQNQARLVARAADAENIVAADSTNERKHNDRVTDAIVSTSCMVAIDADVMISKCNACDHDAVMKTDSS